MSLSETPCEQGDPGHPIPPKPPSRKKIEANRRNALRSTGPRTAEGKKTDSHNAIKHGLLAREVVIKAGDGEENLQEFHELLEGLWEDYCPIGVVEEMLVQKIATCWWRLARVLRAENGEVCKRLDSAAVEHHLRRSNEHNFNLISLDLLRSGALYSPNNKADQKLSLRERLLAAQKSQSDLKRNHLGIEYLSALLQGAERNIDSEGYISKKLQEVLLYTTGLCDYFFVNFCLDGERSMESGQDAATGKAIEEIEGEENARTEQSDEEAKDVECGADRNLMRWYIGYQMKILDLLKKHASESARLEEEAEVRSVSLPSENATNKLLRYEAHLDRQLYRAMAELERRQMARKGEIVPPRVHVELAREG